MLVALVLLIVIMVSVLAVDISHSVLIREQLQNATDAGALAGAQELLGDTLTGNAANLARTYAENVAAGNYADSIPVKDGAPFTVVTVQVNESASPRTVTVTATRTVANVFARIIGFGSNDVSATSTAAAYKGIQTVMPGQLWPLAVSLDVVPSKGPQQNRPLNSYINQGNSKQPFTIVLNPQGEKNGAWIKSWEGTDSPMMTLGQGTGMLNGVKATEVRNLNVGDTIMIPLIKGGAPFNDGRTIDGVMGFEIKQINFPREITGYIKDPVVVSGVPGTPLLPNTTVEDNQFLSQHSPWQVMLIN